MNYRNKGASRGSEGKSPKSMLPQNYLNPKNTYKGMYSKPNNDGNMFTYRKAWKKPGFFSPCFITEAATRAAALPDDCYELAVLRMFREEYVAKLPNGDTILSDYREKAPRVIEAIGELPPPQAHKVWECLYAAGIIPSIGLITRGQWPAAYDLYRSMCEEVEGLFLEGDLRGYDRDIRVDDWVEAKSSPGPHWRRESWRPEEESFLQRSSGLPGGAWGEASTSPVGARSRDRRP